VWKPLHLQPAFAGSAVVGGTVAEHLFARGLCLPSGSALTADDLARITGVITRTAGSPRHWPAAVGEGVAC
jgi:dTDP-4-amino-4,6-dideoxygalactose transaminase